MKMKYVLTSLVAFVAIGMTGCGSSNSNDAKAYNGVFVDDAVNGVHWVCGDKSGETRTENGSMGHFGACPAGSTVEFSIGNLILGSSSETNDGVFFVTDIVGVSRDTIDNEEVLKIAQVLQSLDSDGISGNGISIDSKLAAEEINKMVETDKKLSDIDDLDTGLGLSKVVTEMQKTHKDMTVKTKKEAEANLAESKENIDNGDYKPEDVTGAN